MRCFGQLWSWAAAGIVGAMLVMVWQRYASLVPLSIPPHFSGAGNSANVGSAQTANQTTRVPHSAEVFVFLSPHCPISNATVPVLNRLAEEFSEPQFHFLGVIPGAAADVLEADQFTRNFSVRFPLIVDRENVVCQTLGATHTPQAVVRIGLRTIYSGRIDDRFADFGKPRERALHHDLEEVLTRLREGVIIAPRGTPLTGCLIEGPASSRRKDLNATASVSGHADSAALTFCRDVAPIVYQHCSHCHRPGEAAPFSLLTFKDMQAHARQIEIVVRRRQMPPWKPEPGFGAFANQHRLNDRELKTICDWLTSDQLEGDPEELPLMPLFPRGWQLGHPDLELIMPESFEVPADGPDIYQHFVIPTFLTDDRLVSAVEFRPGSPEVVHHSITYFDTTGQGRKLDAEDPQPGYSRSGSPGFPVSGSLGGWGPGGQPRRLPAGMGRPLSRHAEILLQIHYHPIGRPVADRSRVGLYFAPASATHLTTEIMVANVDLCIPAGAKRHHHHAEYELPVDTLLLDATPHMHVLGKEVRAVAIRPDGIKEPLIWIRDWDFYWQDHYIFENPLALPKGTRIVLDCWFDNSNENPLNPNSPPHDVVWGDFSTDEMGICYFQATAHTLDDYQTLHRHATEYFGDLWSRYQARTAAADSRSSAVPSRQSPQ